MDTIKRTKKGYGDFGTLRINYSKARMGFPHEVIMCVFSKVQKDHPYILDIGCGTGIATEQLFEKGAKMVGTDIDAEMIQQARSGNRNQIEYLVAPAEKQPFREKTFDAITTFSAFHWFATKEVADEIKRILKPGGMFFVVNKNEAGNFKKKNKEILSRFIDSEMPDVKKDYDPETFLGENRFQEVETKHFPISEYFTVKKAVLYAQTMSIWNLVSDSKKEKALGTLHNYFSEIADASKKIERKLDVVVVSARF